MVLEKLSRDQKTTDQKAKETTGRAAAEGNVSVVARDMKILGDCETRGRLRIEGTVTGDVSAGELEITSSGSVDGDVTAGEEGDAGSVIVVNGHVAGDVRGSKLEVGSGGAVDGGVTADEALVHGRILGGILARKRLVLEETAEVRGDIRARRLALREGGQVNGHVTMGEGAVRSTRSAEKEAEPVASAGASEKEGTEIEEPGTPVGSTGEEQDEERQEKK